MKFMLACLLSSFVLLMNFNLHVVEGIIGGTKEDAPIPYMVGIKFSKEKVACGGAIISENWILTAAHCFKNDPPRKDACLITGETDAMAACTNQIQQVIPHQDFSKKTGENDIALIRTAKPIEFKNTTDRIQFHTENDIQLGDVIRFFGYGEGSKNQLESASSRVSDHAECAKKREGGPFIVTKKNFCLDSSKKDSANGDSGGPAVILDLKRKIYRLAGLVSFGKEHNKEDALNKDTKPSVYTKLKSYIEWIEDTIFKNMDPNADDVLLHEIQKYKIMTSPKPFTKGRPSSANIIHQNTVMILLPLLFLFVSKLF